MNDAAQFGTSQAAHSHDGLVTRLSMLAQNSRFARLRREFKPPVRLYPYKAHLIVYVEDEDGIPVIRVLHGRQDWERHLS